MKDKTWLPATVPGTVHTDLLANKKIPNPLINTNEDSVQWIEKETWEYKTEFDFTDSMKSFSNHQLIFNGLDTYADVYLDDSLIIKATNMFRTWNYMLPSTFSSGQHQLHIVFHPAVTIADSLSKLLPYTLPGGEYNMVRKAPYQFGWDWGPRLVTCGIWKPIEMKCWNNWDIPFLQFIQVSVDEKKAWLRFSYNLQTSDTSSYIVMIKNNITHELYTQAMMFNHEQGKQSLDFYIMQPQLWWPNEYGKQNLYQLAIEVRPLYDTSKIFCSNTCTVGLRTIQLINYPDSIGSSFYFLVNRVPVYIKGANWIPPSNFLPSVSDSVYTQLIQDAVAAHMNMLRVWGGGVYADDYFLKLCDENGIMVWQDMMFAGAMYLYDTAFVKNILEEVKQNILRERNHPCLALWCGNNEIDEAWNNWGWQDDYKLSNAVQERIYKDYKNIFEILLKQSVDLYDPFTSYIPSSPMFGWGHDEAMTHGDSHYWGVWWGNEPFNTYEKKVPRFMSEFGFQAMPHFLTIKQFTQNLSAKWNDDSLNLLKDAGLMQHQKHQTGYQTILHYVAQDFSIPKTLADFSWLSNLTQADGIGEGIEAQRRSKPYCMGTLYWQLNDCWPVCSWSSIDVNGNYKALQYKLKTLYNPLLISVCVKNDSLQLWLVSDLLKDSLVTVSISENNLKGKLKTMYSTSVVAKANTSCKLFSISMHDKVFKKYDPQQFIFEAVMMQNETVVQKTFHYMAPEKELKLQWQTIDTTWTETENAFVLTLHSSVFQRGVFLDDETEPLKMNNNYFDMDGVHDEVIVIEKTIPLKQLKRNLMIKSLNYVAGN